MALAAALLLGLFSCSSNDSIGDLNGGLSQGPGSSSGSWSKCALPDGSGGSGGFGVTGSFDSSLTGSWVGHVQNYLFASGSANVKLVITGADPPGYVVFGDGAAPPPPTDPDVGYPDDMPLGGGGGPTYWVEEGFHYDLLSADVTAQRVQLHAASYELWKDWCPLQTSYSEGPSAPVCGCLPYTGLWVDGSGQQCALFDTAANQKIAPVDCKKASLCMGYSSIEPCVCTMSGCRAKLDLDVSFDLARGNNVLIGRLLAPFGKSSITLSRQ